RRRDSGDWHPGEGRSGLGTAPAGGNMDEEAIRNYLRNTRAIIDRHGWAVQAVLGSASDGSAYSYTIGFTETLGHPEVFMAGFDPDLCRRLLNDVGSLIRNGSDFRKPCLEDKVIK